MNGSIKKTTCRAFGMTLNNPFMLKNPPMLLNQINLANENGPKFLHIDVKDSLPVIVNTWLYFFLPRLAWSGIWQYIFFLLFSFYKWCEKPRNQEKGKCFFMMLYILMYMDSQIPQKCHVTGRTGPAWPTRTRRSCRISSTISFTKRRQGEAFFFS